MKTVLTIAGGTCSGGAGIQADIKTMTINGVYAMSAITALTAQNTTGVTGSFDANPAFSAHHLDSIFTDIFPDAVKIGMVSDQALIEAIVQKLAKYKPDHIAVDPAMAATSGVLWSDGPFHWFHGKHIQPPNTHGTGCTRSSAIASNRAQGRPLLQAVEKAKAYLSGALGAMLDLGKGSVAMNHAFYVKGGFAG